MRFDESGYEQFLITHRRNKTNPEDLIERYAITLPAADAEVKAQVKAVREYWNKIGLGNSRASAVAKWCRTQDQQLRKEPGTDLESAAWWQRRQSERDSAADASIASVADDLKENYGRLGVVTSGTLGKYVMRAGLTTAQAEQAARRAGLTVVGTDMVLPETAPSSRLRNLEQDLAECKAATVPTRSPGLRVIPHRRALRVPREPRQAAGRRRGRGTDQRGRKARCLGSGQRAGKGAANAAQGAAGRRGPAGRDALSPDGGGAGCAHHHLGEVDS